MANDARANPARQYYKLALSAAAEGNLSRAVAYARYALLFDGSEENAARLLCLCLYETGETEQAAGLLPLFPDLESEVNLERAENAETYKKIRRLAKRGKWRRAYKIARTLGRRSVRVLMIRGCILAASKRYGKAARVFAKALKKDKGSIAAAAYLSEAARER